MANKKEAVGGALVEWLDNSESLEMTFDDDNDENISLKNAYSSGYNQCRHEALSYAFNVLMTDESSEEDSEDSF